MQHQTHKFSGIETKTKAFGSSRNSIEQKNKKA